MVSPFDLICDTNCFTAQPFWAAFHRPISLFLLPAAARLLRYFNQATTRDSSRGIEPDNKWKKWEKADQRDAVYYTEECVLV